MADVSDVLNILTAQVAAAVYPNGTGQASVGSCDVRAYPGWPTAAALDADLLAGKVNISVFPTSIESNVTKYQRRWVPSVHNTPTLSMTLVGGQVTIGGTIPSPFFAQNMAAVFPAAVYVYPVQASDSLNTIATGLASLIPGATSSGHVITLPAGPLPILRVGSGGKAIMEIRRQKRVVQITVWAPTPALRDTITKAADAVLTDLTFLTMPDGSGARVIYQSSPYDDSMQKAKNYRRDLRYSVEFGTTKEMVTTEIVTGVLTQETTTTGVHVSVKTY